MEMKRFQNTQNNFFERTKLGDIQYLTSRYITKLQLSRQVGTGISATEFRVKAQINTHMVNCFFDKSPKIIQWSKDNLFNK